MELVILFLPFFEGTQAKKSNRMPGVLHTFFVPADGHAILLLTYIRFEKSYDLNPKVRKNKEMKAWLPSLNALRAFEAAARNKSFRKAAEELSVTPAAVKQLVTKLEEAIGQPLLIRDGHSMKTTRTGSLGATDLTRAFRQIESAVDRMRTHNKNNQLVITVDPSFASAWLVPRLESFKVANPDVDVLIDSSMQLVDLETSKADVGIRFGSKDHGKLVFHRLFDEELCAYCSPQLAAGPPKIENLSDLEMCVPIRWDLSGFEWAENTRNWNYWRTWLDAVGATDVKLGSGLVLSDYNLAVQAAIAGQGFIIGSVPVLRSVVGSGLLVDPFDIRAFPGFGYDVVTTSEARERPEVNAFFEWIIVEVEQDRSSHEILKSPK